MSEMWVTRDEIVRAIRQEIGVEVRVEDGPGMISVILQRTEEKETMDRVVQLMQRAPLAVGVFTVVRCGDRQVTVTPHGDLKISPHGGSGLSVKRSSPVNYHSAFTSLHTEVSDFDRAFGTDLVFTNRYLRAPYAKCPPHPEMPFKAYTALPALIGETLHNKLKAIINKSTNGYANYVNYVAGYRTSAMYDEWSKSLGWSTTVAPTVMGPTADYKKYQMEYSVMHTPRAVLYCDNIEPHAVDSSPKSWAIRWTDSAGSTGLGDRFASRDVCEQVVDSLSVRFYDMRYSVEPSQDPPNDLRLSFAAPTTSITLIEEVKLALQVKAMSSAVRSLDNIKVTFAGQEIAGFIDDSLWTFPLGGPQIDGESPVSEGEPGIIVQPADSLIDQICHEEPIVRTFKCSSLSCPDRPAVSEPQQCYTCGHPYRQT